MNNLYTYSITIHKLWDGDSITDATIDLGFTMKWERKKIRLYGIDTPEVRGSQKEAGLKVRDIVQQMYDNANLTCIQSLKDQTHKYGQIMAYVWFDGICVNDWLLERGLAKPYFGGKKKPWTPDELQAVIDYQI